MTNGPVMLDIAGTELSAEDRELLAHPVVGGVILFSRNFCDFDQLQQLCRDIHALRQPHLLIAVDQEGGRVQRFQKDFSRLPPAAWYGRLYDRKAEQGLQVCEQAGWLMATELRAAGVDFSFAPVLDLDHGLSTVIGDRAFHQQPSSVAELAIAWCHGAREAGMVSVGKHFPGHGGVAADSHTELPVDERTMNDIQTDLFPFRRLIDNGLEAIMPAHVIYASVDRDLAGFSRYWLREVLRGKLNFNGVIFSDDLSMQATAASGSVQDRAGTALEAGCDMVLVCNDRDAAVQVVDDLANQTFDPVSHIRCIRLHGRQQTSRSHYHEDPKWQAALQAIAAWEAESEQLLV
ncbi:MAG: beta-N-acetylhexosaminidase [gamma proteobacterium symbiont of Bathyaustriella thionipta]|nr:beta-N-acetylhexosaminidase [gamma proteobacterium symbiont of Bathyaustriella thionipta]